VTDLDESFGEGAAERKAGKPKRGESYEFPSSKVRNWDSLKKHAAEVLCFASPVKYEYKVRKIRTSKPDAEIDAFLRGMYKVDRVHKYACQMCHDPYARFEKCQITTGMEEELDAMYLCLCPNCASEYRRMRMDTGDVQDFMDDIRALEDHQITAEDPVEIKFGRESIWFTQTHIAEIRELMALKDAADQFKEGTGTDKTGARNHGSIPSEKREEDPMRERISSGTDVYKDYIGKRIFHKSEGYGIVTGCDGIYLEILFEKGSKAGKKTKYSLEACLSKGLIKIV
jgi:hypothetical protein